MNIQNIDGCCVATNLWNLGGAHGIPRAKDQLTFDHRVYQKWLMGLPTNIICFTNQYQTQEREFLKTIGFTTHYTNSIYISFITKGILRNYLCAEPRLTELKNYGKASILPPKPKFQPTLQQVGNAQPAQPRVFEGVVYEDPIRLSLIRFGINTREQRRQFKDWILQTYFVNVNIYSWDDSFVVRRRIYDTIYRQRQRLNRP